MGYKMYTCPGINAVHLVGEGEHEGTTETVYMSQLQDVRGELDVARRLDTLFRLADLRRKAGLASPLPDLAQAVGEG